jgi:UDP-N-acetylmuramoyl-L-alanyl-D-glutamate--2,6-diaminopimelate ligase
VRTLAELVDGLGARITGPPATPIAGLACDSRRVKPGDLFVALRGQRSDGHRFAAGAAAAGAAALLVEEAPQGIPAELPVARVARTRAVLPEIARRFWGDPARHLTLVGVTGTNGKSSTTRLVEAVLRGAGLRAGSMGTISVRYPDREEPSPLTTPESTDLWERLARMRAAGATHVALEVSSHALAQDRVRGLRFAAAVFTNLTQDHLDFHRDMEDYAAAKARLFDADYLAGAAVLNAADPLAPELERRARAAGASVVRYARAPRRDVELYTVAEQVALDGSTLRVESAGGPPHELRLPLPGDFQVENALAAIGVGLALDLDWPAIRRGIESCPPVPGRLERVADARPIVLVDYAHTPDALERVLSRVRPLVRGRLISVFGCGGDRDRSKRSPMARAACAHSDHAIATSDNPRTEDPLAILRDIAVGLSGSCETIPDRREAIRHAIERAGSDDVVVIAGKGHEDYQIIGETRHPFDDRVEARKVLQALGRLA